MIDIRGLYKSFEDKTVLSNINASFENGKTNLIIGQSGSGKTVLMKCIVGLLTPEKGEVLYDGRNLVLMGKKEKKMLRKEMGMIFQSAALFDSMSVLDNVMFPLNMFSNDTLRDRTKRAMFCLERVNLTEAKDKFPGEISGGMQKRVAIARAIALNPQYLFCDEPNSGLDPKTSLVIDDLIHDITQEYNMTTIINTHDMNSVLGIGEKVIYIYEGHKEWEGTKDDIFTVAYESDSIYIDGVVSKPTLLKSTRIWQTIIVNNRVISDKTIMKAIDNAYHALLPKNGHPLVVLNITVPAGMVDINVHPRKSEVKFSDDKIIFKAVYHGILNALNNPLHERYERESSSYMTGTVANISDKYGNDIASNSDIKNFSSNSTFLAGNTTYDSYQAPTVVHDSMQSAEHIATAIDYDKVFGGRRTKGYEVMRGETSQFVENLKTKGYTPPAPKATYEQSSFVDESFEAVPTAYTSYTSEDVEKFKSLSHDIRNEEIEERTIQNSGFLPMGQVASCYILAKKGDDLYIIDQHAAHERVRYDKLCKSSESIPMQSILVPQYSEATNDEMNLVEEERETLLDLGFDVELGGPTKIKLVGAPVDLVESKAFEILQYIFSYLHDHQQPTKAQLRHEMLAYASCRGAIKAGHNLNMYQMTTLIEDLFSTEKPYVCPHGRPTIIKFTPDELGKLFLRS